MRIGVICAEEIEMNAIKVYMENIYEENKYNLKFFIGNIKDKEVILVECGIGKVNSARTTQILIDSYRPDYVINTGSAGAVKEKYSIADIIIGEKLIQYDYDVSDIVDKEKGQIFDDDKYFYSDSRLIELCKKTIDEVKDKEFDAYIGLIGTADKFCSDPNVAIKVREEFNCDCVEMEGAAIAQVCMLDKVPCLVIRGISDTPNGNNKIDFMTYLETASKSTAIILDNLIEKI